jgi:hypothetical protein
MNEIVAWDRAYRALGSQADALRRWRAERRKLLGPKQKAAAMGMGYTRFRSWRYKLCGIK